MQIINHWRTDAPRLHFELLDVVFDANPEPALQNDADPDPHTGGIVETVCSTKLYMKCIYGALILMFNPAEER